MLKYHVAKRGSDGNTSLCGRLNDLQLASFLKGDFYLWSYDHGSTDLNTDQVCKNCADCATRIYN
jgi:hypothetical protein